MIKVAKYVVEESAIFGKNVYCKYELKSSREKMINDKLCISSRRRCKGGSMVTFWDTDRLSHTYMIYVEKTRTYYYTNDMGTASGAYVDLLDGTPFTFLKKD